MRWAWSSRLLRRLFIKKRPIDAGVIRTGFGTLQESIHGVVFGERRR